MIPEPDPAPALRRLLAGPQPIWLRVGRIFDGERALPGALTDLVFDRRSILHVASAADPPPTRILREGCQAPDLVLEDHVALPGLIDSHTHLFLQGGELSVETRKEQQAQPDNLLLEQARARLPLLAGLGVMGLREAGDRNGVGLALSTRLRRGEAGSIPYVDSPGPAIHRRGRYGSFLGEPIEDHSSPEDCVHARFATGASRIKLIATGVINFKTGTVTTPPQLESDVIGRIVAAASALGMQTLAHATGTDGIQNAIDGGVDTIEHGYFLTAQQLSALRDLNIAWVPTFVPVAMQVEHAGRLGWPPDVVERLNAILEKHGEMLRLAEQRGVRILAGSDAGSFGVPHGLGLLRELELLEAFGLSPQSVLRTATGSPACRLAFSEPVGRLAPGYRTRLILTAHDPLQGVKALRRPALCVLDGELFAPPLPAAQSEIL